MVRLLSQNLVVISLAVLLFAGLSCSTPINKNSALANNDKEETAGRHTQIPSSKVSFARTMMSSGMDFMKDMFDFGSVTWVPLGSLLFGKKDDSESLSFAKWPVGNKN